MFYVVARWLPERRWAAVPFIGFSATPWTKGLGAPGLYQKLITGSTIPELVAARVLVPFRTFAPDMPDLTGVREQAGDFVAADLDETRRPRKLGAHIVA